MTTAQTQEQNQQADVQQRSTACGSRQTQRVEATQHQVEQGTPTPNTVCGYGTHITQLRRDAPCRPPNWRTLLAVEIARHPDSRVVERLLGWADEWVEKLLRVQESVLEPHHPLAQARVLLVQGERRIEVEARLLAGQSSTEIAGATGLGIDVIEWYEVACFACRDRLAARGYVVHTLLGSVYAPGNPRQPPFELLGWYGYFLGPLVLDAVLDTLRHWEADERSIRGMPYRERVSRRRRMQIRTAILARMLPTSGLSAAQYRRLMEMSDRVESGRPVGSLVSRSLRTNRTKGLGQQQTCDTTKSTAPDEHTGGTPQWAGS